MKARTKLGLYLMVAGLVLLCLGAAQAQQGAIDWYVVSNAYDNTGTDGFWYYSYEIMGAGTGTQTLSQWWLLVPGVNTSLWTELATSPRPPSSNWPYGGDWSNASGYTNGYSWLPSAAVVKNGGPAIWWLAEDIKNTDKDANGVPEAWEPGVDSGYLATYALTHVPLAPDTAENTDVVAGWFQMKSPNPPRWTPYIIQDGVDQWKGMAKAPTPELPSVALLALGLPLGLRFRRRTKSG